MTWTTTLKGLKGNKVAMAIEELHRAENDLARALLNLSEQQRVDHEVFYVARDIAQWSREHVRDLARIGCDYGLELDLEPEDESDLVARLKQKGAEALGRFHEPSLLLLADLRHVHRSAAGASLDWEILAQTAQALHDTGLLEVTQRCHPQTLRQLRWANAKLKETAAQVMVTG
jgi:hypothetical protein